MGAPKVLAAGGVVTRWKKGTRRWLVVHRPRYDDWSLPKGKVDGDDDHLAETALREVAEETGVTALLGPHVATVEYDARSGGRKRVQWWAMEVDSVGRHEPDDEVDKIKWHKYKKLRRKLTYGSDHLVVDGALQDRRSLLVVRHAKAGRRGSHDPDHERSLSKKGRRQAKGLVDVLAGHAIDTVVTSPFTRCMQTVRPLATARGLAVEADKRLAEGADVDDLLGLVEELPTHAVLCTHADVIDVLRAHWDDDRDLAPGMEFPHRRRKKGSTWWVTTTGTTARAARWLPPA